ncbi:MULTISPECIES: hypothetical protein [Bacillus cereus group]|nr:MULTISPECIES: hypothetical protein [Bacillus cereus group]SCN32895.1 Protein of unknown function [Bacillus cytotoxicus]
MKKTVLSLLGVLTVLTLTFGASSSLDVQQTVEIIAYTHGHTG